MPMLRPQTRACRPPPLPRRSSTLSDSRLPSHFMLLLLHLATTRVWPRGAQFPAINPARKGLIGKQRYARLPPWPVPDSGFCTAAAPEACIKCDHADHASCRPFCRAPIHEAPMRGPGNKPLKDAIGAIEHPPPLISGAACAPKLPWCWRPRGDAGGAAVARIWRGTQAPHPGGTPTHPLQMVTDNNGCLPGPRFV